MGQVVLMEHCIWEINNKVLMLNFKESSKIIKL